MEAVGGLQRSQIHGNENDLCRVDDLNDFTLNEEEYRLTPEDIAEIVAFWKEGAKESLEDADILFKNGRYVYAVYTMHLTFEKWFKSKWVERLKKSPPPKTHELIRLANEALLSLSPQELELCEELTKYNISGRYGEYRKKLFKATDKATAAEIFSQVKNLWQRIVE